VWIGHRTALRWRHTSDSRDVIWHTRQLHATTLRLSVLPFTQSRLHQSSDGSTLGHRPVQVATRPPNLAVLLTHCGQFILRKLNSMPPDAGFKKKSSCVVSEAGGVCSAASCGCLSCCRSDWNVAVRSRERKMSGGGNVWHSRCKVLVSRDWMRRTSLRPSQGVVRQRFHGVRVLSGTILIHCSAADDTRRRHPATQSSHPSVTTAVLSDCEGPL